MKSKAELESELAHFTGSSKFYRWSALFRNFVLTEGVRHLCENGGGHGCYWLADAVASYMPKLRRHKDTRLHEMQFWTLKVAPDRSAVITCVADTGEKPAVTQKWDRTDLQLDEVRLWVQFNGEGYTIMLPGEY